MNENPFLWQLFIKLWNCDRKKIQYETLCDTNVTLAVPACISSTQEKAGGRLDSKNKEHSLQLTPLPLFPFLEWASSGQLLTTQWSVPHMWVFFQPLFNFFHSFVSILTITSDRPPEAEQYNVCYDKGTRFFDQRQRKCVEMVAPPCLLLLSGFEKNHPWTDQRYVCVTLLFGALFSL